MIEDSSIHAFRQTSGDVCGALPAHIHPSTQSSPRPQGFGKLGRKHSPPGPEIEWWGAPHPHHLWPPKRCLFFAIQGSSPERHWTPLTQSPKHTPHAHKCIFVASFWIPQSGRLKQSSGDKQMFSMRTLSMGKVDCGITQTTLHYLVSYLQRRLIPFAWWLPSNEGSPVCCARAPLSWGCCQGCLLEGMGGSLPMHRCTRGWDVSTAQAHSALRHFVWF